MLRHFLYQLFGNVFGEKFGQKEKRHYCIVGDLLPAIFGNLAPGNVLITYLFVHLQPADEALGIDKLKAEVPNLS